MNKSTLGILVLGDVNLREVSWFFRESVVHICSLRVLPVLLWGRTEQHQASDLGTGRCNHASPMFTPTVSLFVHRSLAGSFSGDEAG